MVLSLYFWQAITESNIRKIPISYVAGFSFTLLKKISDFPVLSRDVTNQTLPGRE